jgi:rubrerythrin
MSPRFNRRQMLTLSGSGALAAFLAACGKQAGVTESDNIRALGIADDLPGLANEEINDVVLLRTAASLEYTAIDTYEAALNLGVFSGSASALRGVAARLRDDHRGHADAVNGLVVAAGGTAFECANPRFNEIYIAPALAAITDTDNDNVLGDVLALAHGLEVVAAQTYQSVVGLLSTPALRRAAMTIGQDESRHAAVLAQAINPGAAGVGPSVDGDGRARIAAVPAAFGELTPTALVLGPVRADGSRLQMSLETPSLNAFIYPSIGCS